MAVLPSWIRQEGSACARRARTKHDRMSSLPSPAEAMLSAIEARILGCLIEKEATTPDVYPLTLNALVNACNQRNNRAPIMALSARDVEAALEPLRLKRWVVLFSGADARVPKYRHSLDAVHPVEPVAQALLAELLLRGPQTAAELRGRAERLAAMPDLLEVEAVLADLAARPATPLVRLLPRQAGQKEQRWAQLLTGEPALNEGPAEPLTAVVALPPEIERRLDALEAEVAQLRTALAELRKALGGP